MWRFLSDSVAGVSHARTGIVCQDACTVSPLRTNDGEEVLVVVCSDGAGSAELSDVGSRIACDTLARAVDRFLQQGSGVSAITRECALAWLTDVRAEIDLASQSRNVESRSLACTLLAAVLGESESIFIQLGDGAMVVGAGGDPEIVFWPQNGEFANTTYFVTDETALEQTAFVAKGRFTEIAVFSDGLQMLVLDYAAKQAFAPFLVPMFRALREAGSADELRVSFRAFLDSPRVNERTDDDKSLILAVREHMNATAATTTS